MSLCVCVYVCMYVKGMHDLQYVFTTANNFLIKEEYEYNIIIILYSYSSFMKLSPNTLV